MRGNEGRLSYGVDPARSRDLPRRSAWLAGWFVLLCASVWCGWHMPASHGDDFAAAMLMVLAMLGLYGASSYCGARSCRSRRAQVAWVVVQGLAPVVIGVVSSAGQFRHLF